MSFPAHLEEKYELAVSAQGVVVIDAAPWAEIVEVRSSDGQVQALESDAFTPLRLDLAEGAYQAWLRRAYRAGRILHGQRPFDAVHHATFSTYWLPSPVGRFGVPAVWGPVGGAVTTPIALPWSKTIARVKSNWVRSRMA